MGTTRPIKKGEIWLVNLDTTIGSETKKTRPAAIIQNDTGNKYSDITIIAPITSQNLEKTHPIEVFLTKKNSGLKKESKIMLNQIRAIDKRRLIKKQGKLNEEAIKQMNEAIKISLDLK